MASIDEKFLDELKSKVNIVDVAQKYCVLSRKGPSNYWARCPFPGHTEKTPSFSINEPGQFCHCFGCGKGGDVIHFIEEVENLTFYESVKYLAEYAKMPLPENDDYDEERVKNEKVKRERQYQILRETALFYVRNLNTEQGEKAREYIKKRGFSTETVKAFGLGVSLDYNGLPNYLLSKGFSKEEILSVGVCQVNQKGIMYDAEAGRLTIPVINAMNKVIAFTGRILEKNDKVGKYKNTAETPLYQKKRMLYAINNLKKYRLEYDFKNVIMVEGNLDAVSLYQAGFKNVVASMGTSLTLEQAKLLKRYTDTVLISYDGDFAGQKATVRSLEIFENEGFEVRVVNLPEGKDPDEIIQTYGKDAYQKLLDNALPLIDFKLKLCEVGKNFNVDADKRKYVQESLEIIKTVSDAFLREELLKKVRAKSGITYESLKRDVENGGVEIEKKEKVHETVVKKSAVNSKVEKAERAVLCAYALKKPYALKYDLSELFFTNPIRDKIAEYVLDNDYDIKTEKINEIVGEEGLEELSNLLSSLDTVLDKPSEEKFFNDCVVIIKRANIQNEIKSLNEEYLKETDADKKETIANAISKLTTNLANCITEDKK